MNPASVELLRVPLQDIISEDRQDLSRIKVFSLSERYAALPEPINTIPVLVEALPDGLYKLVQGHEIYQALKEGNNRPWIWAMRLTPPGQSADCWRHEIGLEQAKLNICVIDEETLRDALDYLSQNVPKLSKMRVSAIIERVGKDKMRCHWSSLDALVVPNSGLTKTSLPELSRYLEAIPQPLPPLSPICINTASGNEIIKQLQRLCLESKGAPLSKLDLNAMGQAIAAHADRLYWVDAKDACRAIPGLTSRLEILISQGFAFNEQAPPVPNTVRFLLAKLKIKALRDEANARGIPTKGLGKQELVEALAQDS